MERLVVAICVLLILIILTHLYFLSSYSFEDTQQAMIDSNKNTSIPLTNTMVPTITFINPQQTPTFHPTIQPSTSPTNNPTTTPTNSPFITKTTKTTQQIPLPVPTSNPTLSPSASPTNNPTQIPTDSPTITPTNNPTTNPSTTLLTPNVLVSKKRTAIPISNPTSSPTATPTDNPTLITTNPVSIITKFGNITPTTSPTLTPITSISSSTSIVTTKNDYCLSLDDTPTNIQLQEIKNDVENQVWSQYGNTLQSVKVIVTAEEGCATNRRRSLLGSQTRITVRTIITFKDPQTANTVNNDICTKIQTNFKTKPLSTHCESHTGVTTGVTTDTFNDYTDKQLQDVITSPISELKTAFDGVTPSDYHDFGSFIGDYPEGSFDVLSLITPWLEYEPNYSPLQRIVNRMNLIKDLAQNGQSQWIWDRDEIRQMLLDKHWDTKNNQIDNLEDILTECDLDKDGRLDYQELKDCLQTSPLNSVISL